MSWRDHKARARQVVHRTFQEEDAVYKDPDGLATDVNVRLHRTEELFGNEEGGFAEMRTDPYTLIFMVDELSNPIRGGEVTLQTGEKYYIENVFPPDYPNIACGATEL